MGKNQNKFHNVIIVKLAFSIGFAALPLFYLIALFFSEKETGIDELERVMTQWVSFICLFASVVYTMYVLFTRRAVFLLNDEIFIVKSKIFGRWVFEWQQVNSIIIDEKDQKLIVYAKGQLYRFPYFLEYSIHDEFLQKIQQVIPDKVKQKK